MNLHYRILGSGKPLVILHGLFGYSDNWQTLAKKFAEYFQVILVDLRNHGHSPWDNEMTYDLMADDLLQLCDSLKLEEILLLGHSMGGKAAMLFASKYPDRVEKLIVVDIGFKKYKSHHDLILEGLSAIKLDSNSTRQSVDTQLSEYVDNLGTKSFLLKNLYWKEKNQLAWRMNIPVLEKAMDVILDKLVLEDIFLPVLFIRGEQSNYILDMDISELESKFIDFKLITINNAGHWVHAENPIEFSEAVLEFLLR